MISDYSGAVRAAMLDLLQLFFRLAMPLGILIGLAIIGFAAVYYRDPVAWRESAKARQSGIGKTVGYVGVAFVTYLGWSFLQQLQPVAQDKIDWQESAAATSKPLIEAPPIYQTGPAIAALTEKTYTRTLTLPPDFVNRIGAEGIGVLSPYLQDPTTENVLKLADTFRRSGQDVVFTREVTRLEEEPLPMAKSDIVANVKRLEGQAYELDFQATYTFTNPKAETIKGRFQFPVPQMGTMRELKVEVDGKLLPDPTDNGLSEWSGEINAGETKVAKVSYQVIGGSSWQYDMGSRRSRVVDFNLAANVNGEVRFQRNSMEPTSRQGSKVSWQLSNVITNEHVALAFPPDVVPRETFLQALGAMPVALIVFLGIALLLASLMRLTLAPQELLVALAFLLVGFAASLIVANYLGFIAGILVTPLLGGFVGGLISRRPVFYASVTAAMVPATFLSAEHTGLLLIVVLVLVVLTARSEVVRARQVTSEN